MIKKNLAQDRKVALWLLYSKDRCEDAARRGDPGRMMRTRRWCEMIAEVAKNLPVEHRVVLSVRRDLRHALRNENWMDDAQDRYRQMLGQDVSRWTFRRLWREVVEATAREAIRRRLL